ncbi:MAG: hypothetical protein E6H47_04850, partial [Betaproteobacteria bacterium]
MACAVGCGQRRRGVPGRLARLRAATRCRLAAGAGGAGSGGGHSGAAAGRRQKTAGDRAAAARHQRLSPRASGFFPACLASGDGPLCAHRVRPGAGEHEVTRSRAFGVFLALASGLAQAQSPEALGWLRKIQDATQKLSYRGTFVFQHGGRSETSRITRYVDAGGDIDKLEVLDGVPRELVRTRDSIRCYLPEKRVVKVDRRTAERDFPALLPERVNALARHYDISLGESRRIAGFDCQAVMLAPKDNLRYGYKLYADVHSGMLLKAVTLDSSGDTV